MGLVRRSGNRLVRRARVAYPPAMIDADSTLDFTVEFIEDPALFLAAAAVHLAREPVLATVVSSVTHRELAADEAGRPRPDHPRWWAVVREGLDVVGFAMRTAPFPPHPLFVLPMPHDAARAIARAVHARGEHVGGVNGARPAVDALAEESARLQGGGVAVEEHTRLFELGALRPPAAVPGRLRAAHAGDLALTAAWLGDFESAAAAQGGRPAPVGEGLRFDEVEDLAARIAEGRVWLWEDEHGEVVHLTGVQQPAFGVTRIGPVYTPPAQRGRGFASATVAAVTGRLVDDGVRVCLFTDQANTTSNGIYLALGFEPLADMVNLVVG